MGLDSVNGKGGETKAVPSKMVLLESLNSKKGPASEEFVNLSSFEGRGRGFSKDTSRQRGCWYSRLGSLSLKKCTPEGGNSIEISD